MRQMYRAVALLIVGGALTNCGSPPLTDATPIPATESSAIAQPTTIPTTKPSPIAQATTTAEATALAEDELIPKLQAVVDIWAEAYNEVDAEKLQSVIDPKAFTLRRTQAEVFKYRTESIGAGMYSGRVVDVEPRDFGYVLAHVDQGGWIAPFTFKQIDGEWLMSEPRRAEVGKKQKQETDRFVYEYYPWDEALLPDIIELMEAAHQSVVEAMGKGPETKPTVRLIPTTEVGGGRSGFAVAWYVRGAGAVRGSQTMIINSPESYVSNGYYADEGWQPGLQLFLAHEYVHLINDCCFVPIARQNDWMTEGLAEYISNGGTSRWGEVALAVESDAIIPIQTTDTSRYDKQDLAHLTLLDQDISLAYGLSSSVVNYIVENYGGLDGYWKLIEEFDKTQDFDKAVQNVLGITFEEFQDGWMADLKQEFGG